MTGQRVAVRGREVGYHLQLDAFLDPWLCGEWHSVVDPVSTVARAKFPNALQDIGIGQKLAIRITDSEKRSFSLNVRVGKQNRSVERFRCVEPPGLSPFSLSRSPFFFLTLFHSRYHPRRG